VWDCVKEAHRLLEQLQEETAGLEVKDYRKAAKKNQFKINGTKNVEKRVKLFQNQLKYFILSMEQVSKVIKIKSAYCGTAKAAALIGSLECLYTQMKKVYGHDRAARNQRRKGACGGKDIFDI
jgi:hypothetical protein